MNTPVEERTLRPSELFHQLARLMRTKDEQLSITLPADTTWDNTARAAHEALKDTHEPIFLMPRKTNNQRGLREMARQLAQEPPWGMIPIPGCPIRSSMVFERARVRPSTSTLSEAGRQRLRQMARESVGEQFRQPYVSMRSEATERYLPVVRANVALRGVDSVDSDPECDLHDCPMLLDTGSRYTFITNDLFPQLFKEYLDDPVNEPYRKVIKDEEGKHIITAQVTCDIAFTNACVTMETIVLVVPKEIMPNGRSGFFFFLGQLGCLDRLDFECIPRSLLVAKGEQTDEEVWGDVIFEEYLDMDENVRI